MTVVWLVVAVLLLIAAAAAVSLHREAKAKVGHDDRDAACRFWWGDRGGYDLLAVRCPICNPKGDAPPPVL